MNPSNIPADMAIQLENGEIITPEQLEYMQKQEAEKLNGAAGEPRPMAV